jgi:bifunctional UDP-N-acetylglucosamine pyrophosphorylase/glucosamine-1-phosphate N-acetyltransferase
MLSDRAKVLHEIAGAPLFAHALNSARDLDGLKVIVTGHDGASVRKSALEIDNTLICVEQAERKGTAHAVTMARDALEGAGGDTVMLFGDTPFIRPETIEAMTRARHEGADIAFLGFETDSPNHYGRMVTKGDRLQKIVEWKDATEAERGIKLCNSGVVMAATDTLLRLAAATSNDNASGEYYLTDIAGIGNAEGLDVRVVRCDEAETLGINSRADLASAEAVFQARARAELLANGVTMQAPDTVFLSYDTHIGRDAVIEPNVVFGPGVTVESGAIIRAFSHLEGCHVSTGAVVGPYARLRPGAELANNARVGNFVEVKSAQIGEGAKVNHLTYIGDAEIGDGTNIGAGTITCNYDGVFKHRTVIGKNAFIGSNTLIVAPRTIGDEAMTATGSVINRDVPAGDLAVARGKQENRPGYARKLFSRLRTAKAAKQKG